METSVNILQVISIAAFLIGFFWILFLRKELKNYERSCKESMYQTAANLQTVDDIKQDMLYLISDKRTYFLKLKEKYLRSLLDAVRSYKNSQKEKNRKHSFRTKK